MQAFQRQLIDTAQAQASMQDIILQGKTRNGQTPSFIQNYSYVYSSDIASPIPGDLSENDFTISTAGDSDFIAVFLQGVVFNHATHAAIMNPFCKIQLSDNATQRTLFSDPVLFPLVFGYGGLPYTLQEPRLYTANTIITGKFFNYLTVGPISVDFCIALSGYRVFY